LSSQKHQKSKVIAPNNFTIEISKHSGFCFGVVNAIEKVEQQLNNSGEIYSIGSIVHNTQEVKRLEAKGLKLINHDQIKTLNNKPILFRAHGEPPESYNLINNTSNNLIDGTCPVVLKLQQRIKKAYSSSLENNGQIVLFGKINHPETIGLLGQTQNNAILILEESDLLKINFDKPISFFSQTTMSLKKFHELASIIQTKARNTVKINDTICRQVSNREYELSLFSEKYDIVFFVGDPKSSNSKVLYNACKKHNPKTFFITSSADIDKTIIPIYSKFGICGATSTPGWLMEEVAAYIKNTKLS